VQQRAVTINGDIYDDLCVKHDPNRLRELAELEAEGCDQLIVYTSLTKRQAQLVAVAADTYFDFFAGTRDHGES
jgi:hypothetical protein